MVKWKQNALRPLVSLGAGPRPQKEKNETNPISYNQLAINGLRLVYSAEGWPVQRQLTHRFTRDMRRPRPKSRRGPEEQQQGNNGLCRQQRTERRDRGSNKMTKQRKFSITYLNTVTYTPSARPSPQPPRGPRR